ncbi:hypothetical protein [Bartonella tribocorum]|uniref:Uncharacterized protein n=1 Tax=Bartonella tribocorum TaxID=85701 RepID=A0A2M6USM1_9HYPH|nr:hypothetical protein [Bartonella tribocorum]PIT69163.1 hypothetical protein CEV08_06715 [Bartonella tribocorum]
MKGKNSMGSQNQSFFALEESFLSYKDHIIICLISILIGMGYSALLIPLKFKWSLTVAQDNILLALFVLREVITICVLALMPILLVLYLILTYWLKKKIQQLQKVIQKRGETTHQQNNLSKNDREKTSRFFIAFLFFILLFEVFFTAGVVMLILEFYYFVFKRVRMYCRVKKQLKCVKKEPNRAL